MWHQMYVEIYTSEKSQIKIEIKIIV